MIMMIVMMMKIETMMSVINKIRKANDEVYNLNDFVARSLRYLLIPQTNTFTIKLLRMMNAIIITMMMVMIKVMISSWRRGWVERGMSPSRGSVITK